MDHGEKECSAHTLILVNKPSLRLVCCHSLFLRDVASPVGTTVYKGSVPAEMTTGAVNYLRDANVKMFQVSPAKTYSSLTHLSFAMRKEFHTWHYSGGKLLTGCWTGVTVYQYFN